jgi:heme A synthase
MLETMRIYLACGFPTVPLFYTISMISFWSLILLTIISIVYFIQVGLKKRTSTRRYEIMITIVYAILFSLLALGFRGMDQYASM